MLEHLEDQGNRLAGDDNEGIQLDSTRFKIVCIEKQKFMKSLSVTTKEELLLLSSSLKLAHVVNPQKHDSQKQKLITWHGMSVMRFVPTREPFRCKSDYSLLQSFRSRANPYSWYKFSMFVFCCVLLLE